MIHNISCVILALYTILMISATTNLTNNYVALIIILIFTFKYILKIKKNMIPVILLFIAWIIINLTVLIIFKRDVSYKTILSTGINYILYPAILLDVYGRKFIDTLESIVFYLTALSLPLYILNMLFLDYFNSLRSVFCYITRPVFLKIINYWSAAIYVNAREESYGSLTVLRNHGFMWEPGYFATIIIIFLCYRWLKKGIKYDYIFFICAIAIITTFSTSGYFALLTLLLAGQLKKISFKRILIIGIILFLFVNYIFRLEFLGGKINTYVEDVKNDLFVYAPEYSSVKLNRFGIALYDLSRVAHYPFGFGVADAVAFEDVDVVGVNGISGLLRMWGVVIFIYFMILIYKYHIYIANNKLSTYQIIFLYTAFMVVLFSQNLQYNVLLYLIILYPIMIGQDKTIRNINKIREKR